MIGIDCYYILLKICLDRFALVLMSVLRKQMHTTFLSLNVVHNGNKEIGVAKIFIGYVQCEEHVKNFVIVDSDFRH